MCISVCVSMTKVRKPALLEAPLAFPYHLGPGTRGLTTVLLFKGKLLVDLPGFLHSGPTDAFNTLLDFASRQQSPLTPFLGEVAHFSNLSLEHGSRELKALEPLRSRILRINTVYPGTVSVYEDWEKFHEPCLYLAARALGNPLQRCVASLEFVWRAWEYGLEIGGDPEEPSSIAADRVLSYFQDRLAKLGSPELLLAECALNRYCMPRQGVVSYATDSEDAVGILSAIGQTMVEDLESDAEQRGESLSFYLFDRLLEPHIRKLDPTYVPRLAQLMDEHSEPLQRLRDKCQRTALELVARPPRDEHLPAVVRTSLEDMRKEAGEIVNIDTAQVRSFVAGLAGDPRVWGAVAAFIGSVGSLPQVITASVAVTGLSLLGGKAVTSALERRKKLRTSPWAFVYHASKER